MALDLAKRVRQHWVLLHSVFASSAFFKSTSGGTYRGHVDSCVTSQVADLRKAALNARDSDRFSEGGHGGSDLL